MDVKRWFAETSHRQITDSTIAEILKVTRKTANKRVNEGLGADDLIVISRALGVNPVIALVEMGHIAYEEVEDFLDSDGQLVATAEPGELAIVLARMLNPATKAPEIDELAARRQQQPLSDEDLDAALDEVNNGLAVAQDRTDELTEPDTP